MTKEGKNKGSHLLLLSAIKPEGGVYQAFVRTEDKYRPERVLYTDTGGDGRQALGPGGKVI